MCPATAFTQKGVVTGLACGDRCHQTMLRLGFRISTLYSERLPFCRDLMTFFVVVLSGGGVFHNCCLVIRYPLCLSGLSDNSCSNKLAAGGPIA